MHAYDHRSQSHFVSFNASHVFGWPVGGFDLWGPYCVLRVLVVYVFFTLLDERRDRFTEIREIVSD